MHQRGPNVFWYKTRIPPRFKRSRNALLWSKSESATFNLNPDNSSLRFRGLVNMWERTLRDLIRGLRANKHDEAKFINQAIDEIRTEARSKDMSVKAAAILKMTFVSSIV